MSHSVESILQLIEDERVTAELIADAEDAKENPMWAYAWRCRAQQLRELLDIIREEA